MIHSNLQWAAQAMFGKFFGDPKQEFTGVSTDTRTLKPGELFFCLIGNQDGHQHAESALANGASGVVIDEKHDSLTSVLSSKGTFILVSDTLQALGDLANAWRKKFDIPILALTGSNGKTTTKDLVSTILKSKFSVLATVGNFNNLIGAPKTLFGLSDTVDIAVIEMGMNDFGEIARLTDITQPTLGLITNIGMAHLEKLQSLEGVARAKGELFERLPKDAVAILNMSDPFIAKMNPARTKITYGTKDSDLWGEIIQNEKEEVGLKVQIHQGKETALLSVPLVGHHHLSNILAALAVAKFFKIPLEDSKKTLANFQSTKSRMEVIQLGEKTKLIDDCYNANPSSTAAALESLSHLSRNQSSLAILGEMLELGEIAPEAHQKIGEKVAQEKINQLIAIGPHAEKILEGAKSAGMSGDHLNSFATTEEALDSLKKFPSKPAWILVKGSRGMHLEKIVKYLKEHP